MSEHWTTGNWHGSRDTAEADAHELASATAPLKNEMTKGPLKSQARNIRTQLA